MKTLICGLGNPILSDDSVGPRVARLLQSGLKIPEVSVREASVGGLTLLDLLVGYDKAIIIDAIQTVGGKAGHIYQLDLSDFYRTRRATSSHDVNFATALELGRRLGLALPREIIIFAVEVKDTTTFSEQCTPEVEHAIPRVVDMAVQELGKAKNA